MRNLNIFLLLIVLSLNNLAILANPNATSFIQASCKATRYPTLCIKSLSIYSTKVQPNEKHLAQAALSVTLAEAKSTTMFVYGLAKARSIKPREYQAVKDCIANMADTVDQLSRSISEMSRVGREQDFIWRMSNVQTWVSAALTNENTCLDGFARAYMDGHVKVAIRGRVVYVAQVTSNALSLVNRFATRHRTNEP